MAAATSLSIGGKQMRLVWVAAIVVAASGLGEGAVWAAPPTEPVQAGYGSIKFNGLMQQWLTFDTNATDTFRARRLELKFSGTINPRARWNIMFDPAKALNLNVTKTGGNVTDVSVDQTTRVIQDFWFGYSLGRNVELHVGQEKLPLQLEGLQSSATLETVERNLLVVRARYGDIRDVGLQFVGKAGKGGWALAVVNGEAPTTNDANDTKDVCLRLFNVSGTSTKLHLGAALYRGKKGAAKTDKDRNGFELRYDAGPTTLKGEYMTGKDGAVEPRGWYVLWGTKQGATGQFVLRYEQFDPDTNAAGDRERDLTVGYNWFLVGNNAKIQLNWVRKDFQTAAGAPAPYTGLTDSTDQVLLNFQASW